jgi:glycine betaine/proline transport system ATP-binding protein
MLDVFMRLKNVLHKTIVLITHDFDEAIRLADRIAIMKDGQIIQVGTPEELVVRPATDYVAEFTRDVQRAKVISAKALMRVPQNGATYAGNVSADARVAAFAAAIIGEAHPFAVTDGSGAVIGQIERDDVIDVLAGRSQAR